MTTGKSNIPYKIEHKLMCLILACGQSGEYGDDVVDVQHAKQISLEEERDRNRMEYMTQENG